jgi:ABC-type transport system involved in cytochrome c biogenesis permease subunit
VAGGVVAGVIVSLGGVVLAGAAVSAVMSPVVAVSGAGWVLSVVAAGPVSAVVSALSERLQAAIESASSNAPASVVVVSAMDFIAASVVEVVDGFFDRLDDLPGISDAFDGTLLAFVVPP